MPVPAKWAVSIAVVLVGLVLALYLSQVDLQEKNWFLPKCSLYVVTGLYCPGCGNTRATQSLLHGDLVGALKQNVFFVIALPFLLFGAARTWMHWVFPGKLRPLKIRWRYAYSVVLIVLLVAFTVLRNVPRKPFSWLAPVPLEELHPKENR